MAAIWSAVLSLAEGDAEIARFCNAATERSAETANSRATTITTIQAGTKPSSTREMKAAEVRILSAAGSRSWPSRVTCWRRRAM